LILIVYDESKLGYQLLGSEGVELVAKPASLLDEKQGQAST
jgi:hypothetical protein